MVYRMQSGMGAVTKTKAEKQAARSATIAARDEWKMYVASLRNLDTNLRRGALPADQPLPNPPSSPPEMAPDLFKDAKTLLEKKLPAAREVARNLDIAKGDRAATSSYAAGQPAIDPSQGLVNTYVPRGDLPGNVQQFITDEAGSQPALVQDSAPQAYGTPSAQPQVIPPTYAPQGEMGPYQDPGAFQETMYIDTPDGVVAAPRSSPMKKILIVVGLGLAAWLAYRWFKNRK